MKLSIITINFNNRDGLQRTIDSVICQTWHDFEWIVIDGGSTDGSKDLIEQYQENFAYWCSEPDKGIYNAMNKGIIKAQGDYIEFLNSGDIYHSDNVLETVFSKNHTEDIIYGNQNFVSQIDSSVFFYPKKLTIHYFLYRSLGHPSSFIKSSLFDKKGYDEKYKIVSDWKRFIEWFLEGKSFKHIDMIIADFNTEGVSSSNWDMLSAEQDMVYDEIFSKENRRWIEESIEMQKMKEFFDSEEMCFARSLIQHGGKQRKMFRCFMKIAHWFLKKSNHGEYCHINYNTLL